MEEDAAAVWEGIDDLEEKRKKDRSERTIEVVGLVDV